MNHNIYESSVSHRHHQNGGVIPEVCPYSDWTKNALLALYDEKADQIRRLGVNEQEYTEFVAYLDEKEFFSEWYVPS